MDDEQKNKKARQVSRPHKTNRIKSKTPVPLTSKKINPNEKKKSTQTSRKSSKNSTGVAGEHCKMGKSESIDNLYSSNPEFERFSIDASIKNSKRNQSDLVRFENSSKEYFRHKPSHVISKKSKRLSSRGRSKNTRAHSFLQMNVPKKVKGLKSNEGIFGYPRLSEDCDEKVQLITPIPGFLDFQLPVVNVHKSIDSIEKINIRYSFNNLFNQITKTL